jgi:hypothetical protein
MMVPLISWSFAPEIYTQEMAEKHARVEKRPRHLHTGGDFGPQAIVRTGLG